MTIKYLLKTKKIKQEDFFIDFSVEMCYNKLKNWSIYNFVAEDGTTVVGKFLSLESYLICLMLKKHMILG